MFASTRTLPEKWNELENKIGKHNTWTRKNPPTEAQCLHNFRTDQNMSHQNNHWSDTDKQTEANACSETVAREGVGTREEEEKAEKETQVRNV